MNSGPVHLVNIVPLNQEANRYDPMHAPLGILYVGSALKRRGFRVVLHHITSEDIDRKAEEILSDSPLFVGFSVLSGLTTYHVAMMSPKNKKGFKGPYPLGRAPPLATRLAVSARTLCRFRLRGGRGGDIGRICRGPPGRTFA